MLTFPVALLNFSSPQLVDEDKCEAVDTRGGSCGEGKFVLRGLPCAAHSCCTGDIRYGPLVLQFYFLCPSINSFMYLNFWLALWSLVLAFFSFRHFLLTSCCCYFCFLLRLLFKFFLLFHSLPHSAFSLLQFPCLEKQLFSYSLHGKSPFLFSALLIPHQHLAKGKNSVRAPTAPSAAQSVEDESRALPLSLNPDCKGKVTPVKLPQSKLPVIFTWTIYHAVCLGPSEELKCLAVRR